MPRFLIFALLLLAGCSKRSFTSKEESLRALLAKVRKVPEIANAKAKDPEATPKALQPSMVLANVASTDGNTLVLRDAELNDLGQKINCFDLTRSVGFRRCSDRLEYGAKCLLEAASVLERGEYIQDAPSREWAADCADYLGRLRYVVFLKTDAISGPDATNTFYKGTATVVDLEQGAALGHFHLDVKSEAELGGTGYDRNGNQVQYIVKKGSGPLWITRNKLKEDLPRLFPGTQVKEGW